MGSAGTVTSREEEQHLGFLKNFFEKVVDRAFRVTGSLATAPSSASQKKLGTAGVVIGASHRAPASQVQHGASQESLLRPREHARSCSRGRTASLARRLRHLELFKGILARSGAEQADKEGGGAHDARLELWVELGGDVVRVRLVFELNNLHPLPRLVHPNKLEIALLLDFGDHGWINLVAVSARRVKAFRLRD